ncbi:pyridoxamine 5'-phosphate oxidase family protein [Actinoplanes oblitus]|uniref:Pyridoxamine 5'-phosphate oxidase family protein n=1 Tax=Actinoplanes oblitus TaxID=3040509 RepID=A0ABY8W731_9ACTN|nr:pyridoxamine 5'-phosphate oxidase family protein [Actinoplanes oblitus]WIM92956.1 pyridoxamine 5'-phosphate oxidase family protein [Actinoplanes oblitus]
MSAPSAQQIWKTLARHSFAVLSHVTPAGEPRSSGVVYTIDGDRMFVVVAKDSWKARHIAAGRRVAVTVPVRRGGLLSLVAPIPPATVSFPAVALVHPGDILAGMPRLAALIPPARRATCTVLELRPVGHYVTYGIEVPLLSMRDPARARARVAVPDDMRERQP